MSAVMTPLGVLTEKIGSGATPRGGTAVYQATGTALIRSQNVLDNEMKLDGVARISTEAADQLKGVSVRPGDVLLNITGDSIARTCLVDERALPARVNQHVAIIRTGPDLHPGYLQKYLVHPETKAHLLSISAGGTRKALTKRMIGGLVVPLRPLSEQRAIAEVLGALDDNIAVNARLSACAEELVIALAGQGKAQCTLADVATRTTRTVKPEALSEAEVDHFSLPAYDESRTPEATLARSIKSAKFAIESPCVLLSKLNPRIPRVWDVVELSGRPSLASTEFIVLQPQLVCSSVLWAVLSQQNFMVELKSMVAGTSGSHQRVRPDDVMTLEITDPRSLSKATQEAITALGRTVLHARLENEKLARTRDALLPLLMSGKVTVKDAEAMVGEVV
ncbi:restriction endonuclease subunit S [Janibacter hoylei]|uniref:restriction endonuclease subunit S n=1 Tax=Janibacter hoylei TaxID=364298 RepID=UPI0024928994|nr:restriction endonuclease subunit S [Janibacter hoylei]